MGKNFKSIKQWYNITRPSKAVMFFQFLTAVIPSIVTVLKAYPAARAITCISVADYRGAIINLVIAFALEIISTVSWDIQYRLDIVQLGKIYPRIQKQICDKIFLADDASFKATSKEKMVNIVSTNIVTLSDFCDYISYKLAYLCEALTTLVIIFVTNFYIGLMIFAIAIIVYLLINALNNAVGRRTIQIHDGRDKLGEALTDIVDNRYLSADLNLKDNLEDKYFKRVDGVLKHYKKRKALKSIRDNYVYLLYTFIILVATLLLVKMVEANTITLTLYLVITPYLTSSITKFVNFFSLSADLQDAKVASLRIKTILDMNERDMIEFGRNSTDKLSGAMTFTNVTYSEADKLGKSLGNLKDFNAQITKNQVVLFEGLRNCGKRSIFYMLRRAVRPDEGTITFDTINIYDFDSETYKHNISYVTNKPYFFNDSIMENLKVVESSKKKIFEVCKRLGVHEAITALPEGYETNLIKNPSALSAQQKFLVGLARALLTKSEIFMIYEFPIGLNEKEQETIKHLLNELKGERTILVFSAQNPIDDILDRHFKIEKGNVVEVPVKKPKKERILDNKDTDSSPTSHWQGKLS